MFIEVRCKDCKRKLCEISHDLFGVVKVWCRHCKQDQVISPSIVMKERSPKTRSPEQKLKAKIRWATAKKQMDKVLVVRK